MHGKLRGVWVAEIRLPSSIELNNGNRRRVVRVVGRQHQVDGFRCRGLVLRAYIVEPGDKIDHGLVCKRDLAVLREHVGPFDHTQCQDDEQRRNKGELDRDRAVLIRPKRRPLDNLDFERVPVGLVHQIRPQFG